MAVHLGYVCDRPDLKKVVDSLTWAVNLDSLRDQGDKAFLSGKRGHRRDWT